VKSAHFFLAILHKAYLVEQPQLMRMAYLQELLQYGEVTKNDWRQLYEKTIGYQRAYRRIWVR